jgi:hypothetical protein
VGKILFPKARSDYCDIKALRHLRESNYPNIL